MQNMIKSYLLIIGAMKSGTTTLFNTLSQHPQIAASSNKEPGFFCFDEIYARGYAWYDALFDFDPAIHRYALEATTDYTKHTFCGTNWVGRLKTDPTRVFKFIYLMRHPLRRIESHARHVQRTRMELGQTLSPRSDHSLASGVSPVSLAASKYAFQIDHFAEYYERGDLLLLTLEDIEVNPTEVFERICKFLSIDPAPLRELAIMPANTSAGQRRLHPAWNMLRSIPGLSHLVKSFVPEDLRKVSKKLAQTRIPVQGRFTLTPDEEEVLLNELLPDLQRLSAVYGVPVSVQWGIKL